FTLLRAANALDACARGESRDQIRGIAMPPRGAVAALEGAVRDEAGDGGAHLAGRTDFLEAARVCRAPGDRLDNRALDSRERCARQLVGRSRKPIRSSRL